MNLQPHNVGAYLTDPVLLRHQLGALAPEALLVAQEAIRFALHAVEAPVGLAAVAVLRSVGYSYSDAGGWKRTPAMPDPCEVCQGKGSDCAECRGTGVLQIHRPAASEAEPLVRYCPGCGWVGPVEGKYHDCCPDGSEARMIPQALAEKCRDTFKVAIKVMMADAAANDASEAAPTIRNPLSVASEAGAVPITPTLPKPLLDLIGRYGDARQNSRSDPHKLDCWERLIAGIKTYAASTHAAPPSAPAAEYAEDIRVALDWIDDFIARCNGDDCGACESVNLLRRTFAASPSAPAAEPFQARVQPWMMECFGPMIAGDAEERNHRFLEESLELVQACGCTASEAHQLVDYVFGRPIGEKVQEAGGVMVTLAALCLAQGLDMHAAGDQELARIWTKVDQIRAKQAAKPKHSPLPVAPAAESAEPAIPGIQPPQPWPRYATAATSHAQPSGISGELDAQGDERATFIEEFVKTRRGLEAPQYPGDPQFNHHMDLAWKGWQARAALSRQPSAAASAPSDEEILAINDGEVYFSVTDSKYFFGPKSQYHAGFPGVIQFARALLAKYGSAALAAAKPEGHSHG